MKIKYKDSDKVLIAMGSDVGYVGNGEVVEITQQQDIPSEPINFYKRTSSGIFERRPQDEIDNIELINNFSIVALSGGLATSFQPSDWARLDRMFGVVEKLCSNPFKNFSGLKEYLSASMKEGNCNQSDIDKIKAVLNQQGIDLDKF